MFAFFFHCRAVSVADLTASDITIDNAGIAATLFIRKGKSCLRPLILRYLALPDGYAHNVVALLIRWTHMRPNGSTFFGLSTQENFGDVSLNDSFKHSPAGTNITKLQKYYYSGHSPRITSYKELSLLNFPKYFIMLCLDLASETILPVYLDSRLNLF